MKRLFLTTVTLLLTFIAVNAVIFNPNMYGYNQNEKELTKFFDKCKSLYNPSEKTFKKVQDTYMQLLDKYPEKRELTMMYYGYLNLIANCPLANKEEGFKLMQDALPKLSNSIPEVLVAAINADIACCYLKGIGTPKDEQKSFAFYQKACEIDSAYAENLAYLYYTGVGTEIDEERAFSLLQFCYKKATNRKSYDFSFMGFNAIEGYEKLYSFLMLDRDDVDILAKERYREGLRHLYIYQDFDAAKSSLEFAAERGLPNAMYELGILYDNMVKLNIEKSESIGNRDQWLAKAAEAGSYPAIYKQGLIKFNVDATFVAQENKVKADAYPYFKQTADVGYGPGVNMVNQYERNGWPKEANLFGDIAKGVLSVAAMASSIKSDGVVSGLTSQMHNTGEQYGEINTIDDFLGALQIQNEQMKAKRREQESADFSSDDYVSSDDNQLFEIENIPGDDSSVSTQSSSNQRKKSTTTKETTSIQSTSNQSSSKSTSSSNKSKAESTRNCRKCGGSGKVACHWCKGDGRTTCAGCDGKGSTHVTAAGKRTCSQCNGKGTIKCRSCNGKGTEKCTACNGTGKVKK